MLNTIFTKTIYEKRWGLLWWSVAMFGFSLLIVLMFPVFRDSFGASLQSVPDSLKPVLGDANDYQQISGFLDLQVYMQMVFFTFIYGIILFTGLLSGEESDGTLQSLMMQPVSRTRIYFEKLGAGIALLTLVSLALLLGIILGATIIGESISIWRNIQATFGQLLVALVFSVLAYALGAILGRRGVSGTIAGSYAFVTYLMFSLAPSVKALKIPNYLSPFKYYTEPRILKEGMQLDNLLILVGTCAVIAIAGWLVFRSRDVFQR